MEALKKILNILVMVYLLVAFLFLLRILSVSKFVALFDLADDAEFFNRLLWAGAILLLAELLVENVYIATLKRSLERESRQHAELRTKHTQLKAKHYDQQMKASGNPLVPQPDPARPGETTPPVGPRLHTSDDDEQTLIITPAPMPPTLNPDENPNLPPADHRPLL
ncbi:hypothetical protein ACD591_13215 [Rufibacter glacialis]|uniref:Uncharacterized protein n=1 Tax=Rufibacter glacialis TaxID=1259555 RepID=A0A5M8Q8C3_9BACT|nr:hypothetical protein [Rufibacter glacialis]KAA6431184.1 hypothetical protein FOE74_19015 [Rufibacter glacialis]GGK84777.1 hypothetical protein GCM10011405_35820 [Rufibacter glacialis]